MEIKLRRVYEGVADNDGLRILVDKLWPRGIKKSALPYDIWAKEVTPSDALRRLFHLDPERNWEAFAAGYADELHHSEALQSLVAQIKALNPPCVTLLYAFRNTEKNHALILKQAIEQAL
jgi:uncharacterized protein YeaO (DUF488 family)